MVWVRLDDHFDENPKILSVGPLGLALWVSGLAYCNRNLTDGFIPTSIALRLLSLEFEGPGDQTPSTMLVGGRRSGDADGQIGFVPDRFYIPNLLVVAALWESVPGGYQVHDYAEFQPIRAEIEKERAAKRAAGKAGGIAAAQARAVADGQAKSKPVPVPVPVTTPNGVVGAHDALATLTAFVEIETAGDVDYAKQLADEHSVEQINTALAAARRKRKSGKLWLSHVAAELPDQLKPTNTRPGPAVR